MKRTIIVTLLAAIVALGVVAQEARPDGFLKQYQLPSTLKYLPAPPDTLSAAFFNDYYRYQWGRSLRPTPRGLEARADSTWQMDVIGRFEAAYGMPINAQATPELYKLAGKVLTDMAHSTDEAKNYYKRQRPYAHFNQPTLIPESEETLRNNGSYPSGHTAMGWGLALVLAEINVARQDQILERGYQFGQSRVIAGYHYQSDVDAGRLAASAAVARLHADEGFARQMQKAKEEFARLTAK